MARSNRKAALTLAIALLSVTGGCASWDRESYSLIIRKPAHRYQPPPADDTAPKITQPDLTSAAMGSTGLAASYTEEIEAYISREAFRPFTYCYEHQTSHVPESLVAIVAAPAEYPLALTGTLTSQAVQGTWVYLEGLLALLFPRAEVPEEPPPVPIGR